MSSQPATLRSVSQLNSQQSRAIDLLTTGMRELEVAAEIGVDRTTVWRWRTDNASFQAELNRRRQELWAASIDHLRSLVPAALTALQSELEGPGRLRAATTIIEAAGFRTGPKSSPLVQPSGPTTAAAVERAKEEALELEELMRPFTSRT